MIQVEIIEQYIEELDDNSFAKLRDWFIEFDQARKDKKLEKDSALEKAWNIEAENRLQAYRTGKLRGIPMKQIFADNE